MTLNRTRDLDAGGGLGEVCSPLRTNISAKTIETENCSNTTGLYRFNVLSTATGKKAHVSLR